MEHRELLGQGSYFIRYCSGRYICQIPWHVQRRVKLNMNHSLYLTNCCCFSVTQSCLTLWPHGRQHTRLPCPSPSLGVFSNSCSLSQSCYLTISSSVIHFFCFQSFPALRSFPMSWLFASGGQGSGASSFQRQSFRWIFRVDIIDFRIDCFYLLAV